MPILNGIYYVQLLVRVDRMRVAIVGGRLQGIEAAYLCSKAAYVTVLLDRDVNAPAKALVDEFHAIDVVKNHEEAKDVLKRCDAVLPAIENREAITFIEKLCDQISIPFMQDNAAFRITSDKTKLMDFFLESRIPAPDAWPKSGFPVVVKPSSRSGSESVYRANDRRQLETALEMVKRIDSNPIVQEFIEGQALSLEVIARRGLGQPLQITALEFDEKYGCKRVYAPVETSQEVKRRMTMIGIRIASKLGLNGLTDVQALVEASTPKVNEINARLPSQTPTVVYHSSGINMAELLVKLYAEDRLDQVKTRPRHAVIYQHVKVFENELKVQGEHVMANACDLRVEEDFFGADQAITNLKRGIEATDRVATLIVKSHDLSSAARKMKEVVEKVMSEFRLERYRDPSPRRRRSS